MKKDSVLVIFGEELPKGDLSQYSVVLSGKKLKEFIESGSIYEASAFAEELSHLKFPDGSCVAKSFIYKGYELWWIRYNSLFTYFGLPYTQYKRLLSYLKDFPRVYFYKSPYKSLFATYLSAYGCEMIELNKRSPSIMPLGILLQVFLTLLSLPALMLQRRRLLIFTGDKFEKSKDYDFRMKFIYQELRQRKIPFVEFIRSLESWKAVLKHFFVRKRPVIYSEAVAFVGRSASVISGGRYRAKREFGPHTFTSETDPRVRFKLLVATQSLLSVYDDIWAIRIMKWILQVIGVRATFVAAALERNFHVVLGCKLNDIPTIGILHGAPSKYYNAYDFLPGFNGAKMLSVDKYGLWSKWWKKYYLKNSKAYRPEQLYISGLMRPLEKSKRSDLNTGSKGLTLNSRPIKVLFISEQLAAPLEVMLYLKELLKNHTFDLTIKFRPYRDGFEEWLLQNEPDLLEMKNMRILRGSIQDAVKECDVIIGSHSTAVLEALLQFKIPLFFNTQKWSDCFSLKEYGNGHPFFADNPTELSEKIKNARTISNDNLRELQERFFGDPYKNGSKWVVDQLEDALLKGCMTK